MRKIRGFIKKNRIAPRAGIIGPLLSITIFIVEGWLREDYNAFRNYISQLALGPRGWVQIANFIIFGILLLIFTLSLINKFRNTKESKIGAILIAFIAISFIVAGIFVIDLSDKDSLSSIIHNTASALIFVFASISCFVFFHLFREHPRWQNLSWWTLTTGIIILTLFVGMEMEGTLLNKWQGLTQRIATIVGLLWIFGFEVNLLKEKKKSSSNAS